MYLAGLSGFTKTLETLGKIDHGLESYFYLKGEKLEQVRKYYGDFFLDSGAFSAWSKKKPIDLDKYIGFIRKYEDYFTCYASLDDITDPEKTIRNTRYMEKEGLKPIPTFHYGEPWFYLDELLKEYEYIALGGMVPISTKELLLWLDQAFQRICGPDGRPKVKVHGFGLTTVILMTKYPWYSVDSTSAVMSAAMGRCILPNGTDIDFSQKSGLTSLLERMEVERRGYKVEELRNHYRPRQLWNIQVFKEIEKELSDHPPTFVFHQLALL